MSRILEIVIRGFRKCLAGKLLLCLVIPGVLLSGMAGLSAQEPLKRELRASWLTTVWGLDWPGVKIPAGGSPSTVELQKQQLTRILDSMRVVGMNAVFFQVRPECDAFYPSTYEPWSAHLSASRGQDPGWDPLAYAIAESHSRGMELHAWLNPYRFESVAGKYAGQPGDYRQSHPEWVLTYTGGGAILDPGNPGVRQRIDDIVREIVTNYDVDGIVFDDYFYAYEGTSSALDQYSQSQWRPAGMDLGDWRRDNVNRMVAGVHQTIREVKPWVTFGVSPFGIWTTDASVAASRGLQLPKGITGMDAYKSIYCDPVAWLEQGSVDYISPQIYWTTDDPDQDYDVLSKWWSGVVHRFGRHLYVSHSLSSLDPSGYPPPVTMKKAATGDLSQEMKGLSMMEYLSLPGLMKSAAGYDPAEYGKQVTRNRMEDLNGAPGSVFFRSTMFFTPGVINYFRGNEFRYAALPPVKSWNGVEPLPMPTSVRTEGTLLRWDDMGDTFRYAVYAVPVDLADQPGNFFSGRYLVAMTYSPSLDLSRTPRLLTGHRLAVSVVDRNGNESPPAVPGLPAGDNRAPELLSPGAEEAVYSTASFRWGAVTGAEGYILEVAGDSLFEHLLCRREITALSFPVALVGAQEDASYYWRVTSRMAGTPDAVSPGRAFTLLSLPRPHILSPLNESTGVEVTPLVRWEPMEGYTFRMQISISNTFSSLLYDHQGISGTSFRLPPGTVSSYGVYYLRMQAMNGDSATLWSEVVKFSTVRVPPQVPVLLSPENGARVTGTPVTFMARGDLLAGSFTFQWSSSPVFPWNDTRQQSVSTPDSALHISGLTEGTWYVRVRAGYSSGSFTDWSPAVSFTFLLTSAERMRENQLSLKSPGVVTGVPATVWYSLPERGVVTFRIKDITGREVAVMHQGMKPPGNHTFLLQGSSLTPGVYMMVLETGSGRRVVRVIRQ